MSKVIISIICCDAEMCELYVLLAGERVEIEIIEIILVLQNFIIQQNSVIYTSNCTNKDDSNKEQGIIRGVQAT